MANNQITPFRLTDQFTMGNFNQRINETNTALQNKAPAGYGLGTTNVSGASYDANNCTRNGWYNCSVNTPNGSWWYILTVANYGNAVIVQKAWYYNGGKVVECMRLGWLDKAVDQGGGWQPWEWFNPPMLLGVEYRTTERYMGKPVYVKLFNFGALPNNDSKNIEYSKDTSCRFIEAKGNLDNGTGPSIPGTLGASTDQVIDVGGNGRLVWVTTYRDYSSKTAYIRVKYYKTTD